LGAISQLYHDHVMYDVSRSFATHPRVDVPRLFGFLSMYKSVNLPPIQLDCVGSHSKAAVSNHDQKLHSSPTKGRYNRFWTPVRSVLHRRWGFQLQFPLQHARQTSRDPKHMSMHASKRTQIFRRMDFRAAQANSSLLMWFLDNCFTM